MAFLDNSGVTTLVTRLKTYFVLKDDVPSAFIGNPKMDGTASAGSGTSYARGNHVHPHDTSKQDVLVSGTNIKTINGESILGSGDITVGGGGGGGYDYRIDVSISGSTVTADYNGSTLTEIATAVANDPSTSVLVLIPTYDNPSAKGMILYASYDTHWGDIASTLQLATLMYDDGDDRFYIRYVKLSGSGNSTKDYRCA